MEKIRTETIGEKWKLRNIRTAPKTAHPCHVTAR
jgi:hypothetical protein